MAMILVYKYTQILNHDGTWFQETRVPADALQELTPSTFRTIST